jgi:transcription elongation GreA/GreB family factor
MVSMSRAFVNENAFVDELPDRPISAHPNLVTAQGLTLIEHALSDARHAYAQAQSRGEREMLAKAGRDLRYWSARRASAQVLSPDPTADTVQFGSKVTISRDDGRVQMFRIVGEDEAEPARGSISYVSPLARALFGKSAGDVVVVGNGEAELTAVDQDPG